MSDTHGYFGDQVEAVKAATNLPDLVGETTTIRKDGSGFVALCPFHQERSPSLGIFDRGEGWRFYCHGCKVGGDAIHYVELRDGLTFRESVEALAARAHITLKTVDGDKPRGPSKAQQKGAIAAAVAFYADQLASPYGADARAYLAGRGFTADTIANWQIGWAPGKGLLTRHLADLGFSAAEIAAADLGDDRGDRFYDRVIIPIADIMGHPIALAGRLLPGSIKALEARGTKAAKYINTKETELYSKGAVLFGLAKAKQAMRDQRAVTIVEGQLDVIAAHQLGQPNTVATCGTSLTASHTDRLRQLIDDGQVVVQFDGDAAGQINTVAALAQLWQVGLRASVAVLQGVKDLGEALPTGTMPTRTEQSGDRWLIRHLIPKRADDELDRLPQADAVLAVIKQHADADWRGLVAERLAAHLGFAGSKIKSRLKVALGGVADPEISETPGKPAAGAGDGADVRDGGLHQAIIVKLRQFLADEHVEADAVGGWLKVGTDLPVHRTTTGLASDFWFRFASHFISISPDRVRHTLDPMVNSAREDRRAKVLAPILEPSATDAGRAQLVRWVRAVTGGEDATDVAVMAHFLWQVKRRSAGLRVAHDVMPIVVGLQGNGKSVSVEKLCSPLRELVRGVNVTDLTDDRNKAGLASFHIGIWDELAGGSKADLQALKHTVTANSVSFRVLSTHTIAVLPKRMTLIATSNDDVSDIITDTTGARRFYQLNCLDRCDWSAINDIDYLQLWQAVHQDDPPPFDAVQDEIRLRQSKLVHKSIFEQWLESETFGELAYEDPSLRGPDDLASVIRISPYDPVRGEAKDSLRKRMAAWCKLHGLPALSVKEWGMGLKRHGFRDIGRPFDPVTHTRPTSPMMQLPAAIPEHWPVADRLPRSSKTMAERQATVEAAIDGFDAHDLAEILPNEHF